MVRSQSGFTLIELLIVMAVFMVLALAVPPLERLVQKHRFLSSKAQLSSLIVNARTIAFSRRVAVIVCPFDGSDNCGTDWGAGVKAFADRNGNGVFDAQDEPVGTLSHSGAFYGISWASFAGAEKIHFRVTQGVNVSNGTMLLCSKDRQYGVRLVLNRAGRLKERAVTNSDCLLL